MRDRRRPGYLDRLVDQVPGRRGRGAQVPRQLAWGPTRPAGYWLDDEVAPGPAVTRVQPPLDTRAAEQPPRTGRSRESEPVPAPPVQAPRTVTSQPPPRAAARAAVRHEVVHERATRTERARHEPAPTVVHQHVQPTREIRERPAPEHRDRPAAPVAAHLPDAVTRAMERLSALSLPVPQPTPVSVPTPAEPASDQPTAPPPQQHTHRQPALVVAPRPVRDEPTRAPQVHIGSIDVTVAAPPAPPAPPAAPLPARAVLAAPVAPSRLSRPPARYGFGQG